MFEFVELLCAPVVSTSVPETNIMTPVSEDSDSFGLKLIK